MQEHHGIVDQEVHFPVRCVCDIPANSGIKRDLIFSGVFVVVLQCCGGSRPGGGGKGPGKGSSGPPEIH